MRTLALAAALALAACAGPTTTVRTVDTRPALAVQGAPAGTTLYVDGYAVGDPVLNPLTFFVRHRSLPYTMPSRRPLLRSRGIGGV